MNTTKVIIAIISLLGFVQARPSASSFRRKFLSRRPKAAYQHVKPSNVKPLPTNMPKSITQCFDLRDRLQKIACLNNAQKQAKMTNDQIQVLKMDEELQTGKRYPFIWKY